MKYSENRNSRNIRRGTLKSLTVLLMLFFAGNFTELFAADAAAGLTLFKNNCARCHSANLQNDLTGPALYGLADRMESGEVDQATLYEWIRNSPKVREEHPYFKSLYAEWGSNMDKMPHLSDDDIANILEWIYTWEPPAAVDGGGSGNTYSIEDDESVSSMWTWLRFLILVILALLGNIAMQVARLRGVEVLAGVNLDKWNGRIMLGFLVLGLIGVFASVFAYKDTFLLTHSASEHGVAIDRMFWITMAVTFTVFVFTNILLFWFAFRYSQEDRKAKYYPENHKLEMIWTAVPAVVLTILVVFGIKTWNTVMADPPSEEEAVLIELNAYQFGWEIRYPGPDGKFGDASVRRMSGTNSLGIDFTQPESRDDFISNDLVMPVGKRVVLKIRSRDVLHSAYLPHFRVKMDAVPGMNTRFHFVPTITSDSMQVIRQDTSFVYELACTEVCGKGHFSMRKVVEVKEQVDFDNWYREMAKTPIYQADLHGTELIEDPAAIKPSTGLTAENKEN